MSIELFHGDCLDIIPKLVAEGRVADAVVTDPPYGLEFMGKEWDKPWGRRFSEHVYKDGSKALLPNSISGNDKFGGANPTCAQCGGRARGARRHRNSLQIKPYDGRFGAQPRDRE